MLYLDLLFIKINILNKSKEIKVFIQNYQPKNGSSEALIIGLNFGESGYCVKLEISFPALKIKNFILLDFWDI